MRYAQHTWLIRGLNWSDSRGGRKILQLILSKHLRYFEVSPLMRYNGVDGRDRLGAWV